MSKILDSILGNTSETYIIAEIGVNHNGSIDLAKESINQAVQCGASAVKFQTFKSEKLVSKYAQKAKYQMQNTKSNENQLEMLKKLELKFEDFKELKQYCLDKGIDFLSTPFDEESAKFLKEIGVDAFKIGSGDMNNLPFISKINEYEIPIILSTGMANLEEIQETLQIITKSPVAILHCTSNYPTPLEDVNLRAMKTMEEKFGKIIGYSDHTEGIDVSIAAVALGAKIIEKHFTIDKTLPGPDHKASSDPEEFLQLVQSIRNVEICLGDGNKRCMPSEENTRLVARKSLVASRYILAGEIITEDMIEIKRPGNGILPKYYYDIVGKKAVKAIESDKLIMWDELI